ncbi:MAG TPA: hypothetical protein VFS97_05360 [Nitrososphaeraceae archaeon]|nr:hypothetical protein [Nitrososphaeraceae archaeon]
MVPFGTLLIVCSLKAATTSSLAADAMTLSFYFVVLIVSIPLPVTYTVPATAAGSTIPRILPQTLLAVIARASASVARIVVGVSIVYVTVIVAVTVAAIIISSIIATTASLAIIPMHILSSYRDFNSHLFI